MSDDDYHLRHEVVQSNFSSEDDRLYEESMAYLEREVAAGHSWERIVKELRVADVELKGIILDDFVKIILAKRHFQGGETLQAVANATRIPGKVLESARRSMLKEVEEAAIKAHHLVQERKPH
ncbi:MAG: hypothetical protein HQL56_09640 [Magnetococcales bacterium]|nr:hypothetical protein [Magnetococcales bacterium]